MTQSDADDATGAAAQTRTVLRRRLSRFVRDHPFLTVFIVALSVRLAAAGVLLVTGKITAVAPDVIVFFNLARGTCVTCPGVFPHYFTGTYSDFATYLVPVTGLFAVFGPSYFLAQLVAGIFGAIGAAATARLAREVVPIGWAVAAGLIVALFPSQVLWGAMPLRDSAIFSTTACLALAIALLLRAKSSPSVVLLTFAVGSQIFLLGNLRQHSTVVAAMALLIIALTVRPAPDRIVVTALLGAGALFMPLLWSGMGVLGTTLLQNNAAAIRVNHASGDSAFVSPTDDLGQSDLQHLPSGLRAVLVEPLPWSSLGGASVTAARFEVPLRWLLLLGSLSAVPLLWRKRRVLAFPALYCSGIVLVLALAEGNFGTLERHRGEIVWPMTLFSVVAVHAMWSNRRKHRNPTLA